MSQCKFCNLENLEWNEDQNTKKWRLIDSNGKAHSCKNKTSSTDARLTALEVEVIEIKNKLKGLIP